MDYEKAYKNLVAKVKNAHLFAQTDSTKNVLEDILPELRESEDERIRKEMIEFFQCSMYCDDLDTEKIKRWVTYLEKQKEQKELPLMDGNADLYFDEWNQQKQNPTKRQCFEEGMRYAQRLQKEQIPYTDFVIKPHKGDDNNPYDMSVSEAQEYAIKRGFGVPFNDGEVYVDERYITQTIGNILRWADEHPKEQKPVMDKHLAIYLSSVIARDIDRTTDGMCMSSTECVALENSFLKGEFDEVSKFLEKKYTNTNAKPKPAEWSDYKDKINVPYCSSEPEWSEEDDEIRKALIAFFEMNTGYFSCNGFTKDDIIQWLKSLRPRQNPIVAVDTEQLLKILPKRQVWSEKDEKHIQSIIQRLEGICKANPTFIPTRFAVNEDILWLKHLRPSWKPSEKQIECLRKVVHEAKLKHDESVGGYADYQFLRSLLQELIKQL